MEVLHCSKNFLFNYFWEYLFLGCYFHLNSLPLLVSRVSTVGRLFLLQQYDPLISCRIAMMQLTVCLDNRPTTFQHYAECQVRYDSLNQRSAIVSTAQSIYNFGHFLSPRKVYSQLWPLEHVSWGMKANRQLDACLQTKKICNNCAGLLSAK